MLNLFIDVTTGNLLASLNSSAIIPASSLSFYIGDTPGINVFLLTPVVSPINPTLPLYTTVPPAGIALQCFITDGTEDGANGNDNPFTEQVNWGIDPTNTYFTALLPLNTASLKALVATTPTASATLKFGFYVNGYPFTFFSSPITMGVGIPEAPTGVIVPQHPLSVEVANQTYMPILPVPGQPLYLASLNGKVMELIVVDNLDGSYELQTNKLT